MMIFNERFLSFIWQYRLYNATQLHCADGEALQVIHPGTLNRDAGPDFIAAKLFIDQTSWIGHVEIHLKSSDWLLHGHQNDPFFDSVILHVVYKHNTHAIYRTNGSKVPVLVLDNLFSEQLLSKYEEIISSVNIFPCQRHIADLDAIVIEGFLSRLIIERFELRTGEVMSKLTECKGDWDQTFYYFLAKSFGFRVNALPFELLADALPIQIISKHKDNAVQVAALVFGQAGFLDQQFSDEYPRLLQTEYAFLKKKYKLRAIDRALWKFLRMRPQNFPTIRLAQFAALLQQSSHLFSKVLSAKTLSDLYFLFNNLSVDAYWRTHYHFLKETKQVVHQPGLRSIQHLLINTVCPLLFAYGKYTDQPELSERAIDLLEKMPAEKNAIVDQYASAGIKVKCAFTSQALLQLNKCYCSQKKCLNCGIGIKILKK